MLKQQIKTATIEAMKCKDDFVVGVLRMLSAAILGKEKDKRYKISKEKPEMAEDALIKESELTDEQVLEVIGSEIKKRKDAIALYEQGNRPELVERETKEMEILKKYLPEQLSEEAIKSLVQEAIAKTGAKEMKDMGKVMAELNPKTKGKADSALVAKLIKESLIK